MKHHPILLIGGIQETNSMVLELLVEQCSWLTEFVTLKTFDVLRC